MNFLNCIYNTINIIIKSNNSLILNFIIKRYKKLKMLKILFLR
jgi:hypothetical protein